jgi:hypothetical protein
MNYIIAATSKIIAHQQQQQQQQRMQRQRSHTGALLKRKGKLCE